MPPCFKINTTSLQVSIKIDDCGQLWSLESLRGGVSLIVPVIFGETNPNSFVLRLLPALGFQAILLSSFYRYCIKMPVPSLILVSSLPLPSLPLREEVGG